MILLVALSYVEGHGIFYRGQNSKNTSKPFFRDSFKAIFPIKSDNIELIDLAVNELYDQMRNGLFHTGMIREKIILSGEFTYPIQFYFDQTSEKVIRIEVNPHKMLDGIEDHLSHYAMRLRDPEEQQLRESFNRAWELQDSSGH